MTASWTQVLDLATTTTTQVAARLLQDFGQVQALEKADGSLVTPSDRWADDTLRHAIRQAFPEHGVLSEETEHRFPDRAWCWIIDPLDGTTNFARGFPLWGISLGLLYQGTPVFGYVAIPPLQQVYYGYWPGDSGLTMPTGAWCNGQPIQVSQAPLSPNQCFNLCTRSTAVLRQAFPAKVRMWGVATYNLLSVAAGLALGGVEATPKIWDIAAVWPIVQAAGGIWQALDGQPVFPLPADQDYGHQAFPTLVVSRPDLLPVFAPLVSVILQDQSHRTPHP
jgi:myo-inositol-1(or 4)-monophosphatase